MCGHKDTKKILKNFSLFTDCRLPRFFCLVRRYSQILQVRETLAKEREARQIMVLISFSQLDLLSVRLYFV